MLWRTMNSAIQFINEKWLWFSLLVMFVLVLLFIWKEWKGRFNRIFFINSIVALIGLVALLFMFLNPTWAEEVQGKAVLLTEGFRQTRLDSLKNQEQFIKEIDYVPGKNLKEVLASVNKLFILGHGVAAFDYWQLDDISVDYLEGQFPSGIVRLNYPKESSVGTELIVQGMYNEPNSGTKLLLQGAAGENLDSTVLKSDSKQGFTLKAKLKTEGKFVYQLVETDSVGSLIHKDPLPVVVAGKEVLRVLIVNQFPSFETKYLKNYLSEEGHELVVRSKITSGKYKFEYFNTKREPIYGFTEKSLASFDVLILDTETFLGLTRNSERIVANSIVQEGLGVFVQPNNGLFKARNTLEDFNATIDGKEKLTLPGWPKNTIEKHPYRFHIASLKESLIGDYAKRIVIGKGVIGTSLIKNSYELVLRGKSDMYQEIWSSILNGISKKTEPAAIFDVSDEMVFVNRPFDFGVRTKKDRPQVQHSSGYAIPLIKHVNLDDKWLGALYPQEKGWDSLNLQLDTTIAMNYFVMDTSKWSALASANAIAENKRFFNQGEKKTLKKEIYLSVSRLWYLLVFICCMGYLWLTPKLWD